MRRYSIRFGQWPTMKVRNDVTFWKWIAGAVKDRGRAPLGAKRKEPNERSVPKWFSDWYFRVHLALFIGLILLLPFLGGIFALHVFAAFGFPSGGELTSAQRDLVESIPLLSRLVSSFLAVFVGIIGAIALSIGLLRQVVNEDPLRSNGRWRGNDLPTAEWIGRRPWRS